MAKYADIIIDISSSKVDRSFQYRVPKSIEDSLSIGNQVNVPFGLGNVLKSGYVIGLSEKPAIEADKIKDINSLVGTALSIESQLIELAYIIRAQYGGTINAALKTVLPLKQSVKLKMKKYIKCNIDKSELLSLVNTYKADLRCHGKYRLLSAFMYVDIISQEELKDELHISGSTINSFIKTGQMEVLEEDISKLSDIYTKGGNAEKKLNEEQSYIAGDIFNRYLKGDRLPSLIYGITGSGKTEVYMEIIQRMIALKKQVIVLIPEIALTYQTMLRFYRRFGSRVAVINSKLSAGERYKRYLSAKSGTVDIIIGPRSALFTPFDNIGCIIIDEEHEGSYISEQIPKYHAVEVAIHRAKLNNAIVVMGSATPSVKSMKKAKNDEYKLYKLTKRANKGSKIAKVELVDLRDEMKLGNKSIFSENLRGKIEKTLEKKEQIILFLNRRGHSGFLSCRSCGEAIKCPHCDVTLTSHIGGKLVCHYCGYSIQIPKSCPACSSPYLASFGIGTQKVEEMTLKEFPSARVLRMDFDTTKKKGAHEDILSKFSEGKADILIGTQMIVKGHDFPRVSLVGVLAADLSLFAGDFNSSERTFQLLTQAVGRAGRGDFEGHAIIQSYQPEHYAVEMAAKQDYDSFYDKEIMYRELLGYPPEYSMISVTAASKNLKETELCINEISKKINENLPKGTMIIGPADAKILKVNDYYRKIIYLKHKNHDILINIKNIIENMISLDVKFKDIGIQFDTY